MFLRSFYPGRLELDDPGEWVLAAGFWSVDQGLRGASSLRRFNGQFHRIEDDSKLPRCIRRKGITTWLSLRKLARLSPYLISRWGHRPDFVPPNYATRLLR
jgi:hypothetical protein